MGSWKGRGNQYIQFVRVLYCKLPTNGKQLPAFPLEAMLGIEPLPQRWEARVLPLCHHGPSIISMNVIGDLLSTNVISECTTFYPQYIKILCIRDPGLSCHIADQYMNFMYNYMCLVLFSFS